MGHLFFQSKNALIFLQNQHYFVIHQEEQAFFIESEQNTKASTNNQNSSSSFLINHYNATKTGNVSSNFNSSRWNASAMSFHDPFSDHSLILEDSSQVWSMQSSTSISNVNPVFESSVKTNRDVWAPQKDKSDSENEKKYFRRCAAWFWSPSCKTCLIGFVIGSLVGCVVLAAVLTTVLTTAVYNFTFAPMVPYAASTFPDMIAVGDFNGGSYLDLVVANLGSNTLSVLLGYGNGNFATQMTYSTGTGPFSVAVGDLNNDGRSDVVDGNGNGLSVGVFLTIC